MPISNKLEYVKLSDSMNNDSSIDSNGSKKKHDNLDKNKNLLKTVDSNKSNNDDKTNNSLNVIKKSKGKKK